MNFFILHGRDFFRERSIIYEKKIIGRMGGSSSGSGSLTGCSSQSTGDKAEETTKAEASQEAVEESTQAEQTGFMETRSLVIAGGDPAGMAAASSGSGRRNRSGQNFSAGQQRKTLSGSCMNASDTEEQV